MAIAQKKIFSFKRTKNFMTKTLAKLKTTHEGKVRPKMKKTNVRRP